MKEGCSTASTHLLSLPDIMTSVLANVKLALVEIQPTNIYMELEKMLVGQIAIMILNAMDSLSQFTGIVCIGPQRTFRKVQVHPGVERIVGLLKSFWIQGLGTPFSVVAEKIKTKSALKLRHS